MDVQDEEFNEEMNDQDELTKQLNRVITREEAEEESTRIVQSIMSDDVSINSERIIDLIITDMVQFAKHKGNKLRNSPEQLSALLHTTFTNLLMNEASYSYFEDLYENYIEK